MLVPVIADLDMVLIKSVYPGFSQDFMNWTEADYTYRGITDHLVGAQYNGQMNWLGNKGRLPEMAL